MSKLMKTVLLSSVLLVNLSVPMMGSAAHTSNTTNENHTGKTDIYAKFAPGNQLIDPVDPADLTTNAAAPNNGAKAGGGLSLVYVTNKLDFGTHPIDVLHDQEYTANFQDSKQTTNNADTTALWHNKAVFEVSDVRGTNVGWQLRVSGSPLVGLSDSTTIKGAKLAFDKGSVGGPTGDNGATSTAVVNALDKDAAIALSAPVTKGAGLTIAQLDPSNIKLMVPANQAKSQGYSTAINWSLSDIPTA